MKITFMGSPEIGATVLSDILSSDVKIDSVITMPDRPKGRSKKPEKTPVKIVAEENKIKVFQPDSKDELTKVVKKINPDVCIVAAYGMIIPNEALDVPKFGMINFHPSLLPELRGPAPISMAIMCGLKETGVTIIQVSEKMDAGNILSQEKINLDGKETIPDLSEKLAHLGSKMIINLIPSIENGDTKPRKQDDLKATYTKMITKDQGKIDWKNLDAESIEQMSRAFAPWPGVYSYWGGKKVDFYDIDIANDDIKPGLVIEKEGKIIIGCKKGAIYVGALKIEGKNKVTAEEFLRGYPKFLESNLN